MGKQTMGFPAQSLVHRMDNKLYKLQVHDGRGVGGIINYFTPLLADPAVSDCSTILV